MPGFACVVLHVLLLVTQALAFSWHGPLSAHPQPLSQSGAHSPSSRQPRPFWWRSRRRSSEPSLGMSLGPREREARGMSLELDNSIATMGQPALAPPRLLGEVGWGLVRSPHPGPPSGPHLSAPVDRRDQLALVTRELDREVMKNVIRQVLRQDMRHHQDTRLSKAPAKSPAKSPVAAPAPLASTHHAPTVPGGSLPRHAARSSSQAFSYSVPSPGNSQAFSYSLPSSSGFGDSFQPAGQDSPNGFSSMGFGSFVEPAADFGAAGFGPPVAVPNHGQKNAGAGGAAGHSSLGFGGFGGFGQVDSAVGQFGWLDPQGPGEQKAVIKPIPTASPADMGGFSQEDKDCDSILTKSCRDDTGCQCYGFYFCNSSGRCEDLTSSASPDSSAAMTFGEKWHDGPAKTLGLTRRRRR